MSDTAEMRGLRARNERSGNVTGNCFAASDGVHAFVRFGFEVDLFRRNTQGFRQGSAFLENEDRAWAFPKSRPHRRVRFPALFEDKRSRMSEKQKGCLNLSISIRVREMSSDVAEAGGAEKRIAECVREYVTVGMANGAFIEGHFNPAIISLRPASSRCRS